MSEYALRASQSSMKNAAVVAVKKRATKCVKNGYPLAMTVCIDQMAGVNFNGISTINLEF